MSFSPDFSSIESGDVKESESEDSNLELSSNFGNGGLNYEKSEALKTYEQFQFKNYEPKVEHEIKEDEPCFIILFIVNRGDKKDTFCL